MPGKRGQLRNRLFHSTMGSLAKDIRKQLKIGTLQSARNMIGAQNGGLAGKLLILWSGRRDYRAMAFCRAKRRRSLGESSAMRKQST